MEMGLSRVHLTIVTGLIHIGPAIVHAVLLAADAANEDAQVFDSTNANAGETFHIEALSGTTFGWSSPAGVLFHKGIYVVVKDTGAHLMIEYHPIKKGVFPEIIEEV